MNINDQLTKIRHVGYIVNDLYKSVNLFKKIFDIKDEDIRFVSEEETYGIVSFAFLTIAGTEIELTHPASDYFKEMTDNPDEGINHIAFQVKDIEEAVNGMKEKGFNLGYISKDLGIFDTGDTKIVYLDPDETGGMLIELVEQK